MPLELLSKVHAIEPWGYEAVMRSSRRETATPPLGHLKVAVEERD